MSNESPLFDEDDFDLDLEEELQSTLGDVFAEEEDDEELITESVDLDPPMKDMEAFSEPVEDDVVPSTSYDMDAIEGGSRAVPAISAVAFCETPRTINLVESVASDRRMMQAVVDIHEGGMDTAIEYLQSNVTPNLLILESSADTDKMIAQIDELAGHCDEGVQVMVIGATNDIPLYRQLMARGVSEYLVPPVSPVQVVRAIGDLFSDPDAPFVGKSISVIGAKGGVGASTIAHNLAWALSENTMVNTALVDLDLSFGTTALDFNHDSQQTVLDALMDPDRIDDAVVAKLLSKATDRLSLFAAPASVNQVIHIDDDSYATVINSVRRMMPYVVLDLPHGWNGWLYQTLISSDEVVLVCQPDLASLRNGKNMIDQVKADRPNDRPPRLIINMMGVPKRPEIPVKDFAAAIGVEPEVILPFDPQLFGTASNNGQMISETDPAAKPSLAIDYLATVMTGRDAIQPTKSLLQKLLGK
ncbi:MAG: AAA family ATPase [Pseudomonadota bacterium]